MADIASSGLDAGLTCWDRTTKYREYIKSLGDNLTTVESKMAELGHVYDDVNRLVSTAEAKQWIRKGDVAGWLERVETHRRDAEMILAAGKEMMGMTFLCGLCFSNCRSRYKQSKLAEKKRANIETELALGRNFKVKEDVAYEPADLILKRSLEALRRRTIELHDVFETVKQRVKQEEDKHAVQTPEVGGWLERVQLLLMNDVQEILEHRAQEIEKGFQGVGGDSQSQRNCTSYDELSKDAEKKRAALEQELDKASGFTVFTYKPDDPLMVEIPLEPPVGLDSIFVEVWKWVQDESVKRIGIYGMGGVGKTTLLKKIHNEFVGIKHDYNMVAWIVVSRPANPRNIQETIWEKLHLPKSEWERMSELDRACTIYSILNKKSFLLFLDDLWDEIDLLDLGIPSRSHRHKSKIIFTTRSEEICGLMQAERTKKVECLPPDKALQLFRDKVGEETWSAHVEIPKLAVSLVKECEYLPLALITVGAAMAIRKHPDEWRCAVEVLKNRPSSFSGMEKRVLSVLEFSYEALPNETQRKCFLYCSIFPEAYNLEVDRLVDLWIAEGFLDECDGIHKARHHGVNIISNLRRVCLLEEHHSINNPSLKFLKLHDVVRDMALWVASEHGQQKNKIICQEKQSSFDSKEISKWNDAEKIYVSLVNQYIVYSPATLAPCSNLSTLILTYTKVETFPKELFSSMPSLRVLDLSHNDGLAVLPDGFGVLVNLRYLDLRVTKIRKLPVGLKNLIKLLFLLVDRECRVWKGLISSLQSLRVFSWGKRLPLYVTGPVDEGEELNVIEELNGLSNQIDDVCLHLIFAANVRKLLSNCPHLQRCLRELELSLCKGSRSLIIPKASLRRMEHLKYLSIDRCEFSEISMVKGDSYSCERETGRSDGSGYPHPLLAYYPELTLTSSCLERQDCFRSLERIRIWYCHQLREVTVLICHAPSLTHLEIWNCRSLEELIGEGIEDSGVDRILSSLIWLRLVDLPRLESICRISLPFPSLKLLEVQDCPKLRQLPLDSSASAEQLSRIQGEPWWWYYLRWDDLIEQYFPTKFVSIS